MKIKLLATILLLCCAGNWCHAALPGKGKHKAARTTLSDPGEENYDMKHLVFYMQVTDTSTYIIGDVSTTAQVLASSMSSYVFELDTCMHIDSASINGVTLPVSTSAGVVRSISLPTALTAGTMFTARVVYHGTPPSGSGFFNGVTHAVSSHGTNMMYTVSDPWVALNWWPTKQSVDDKIDSVDMHVSVPRGVVDGSNGVLVNVDTTSNPGHWQYHWQTHYPITYYLISLAVARYAEDKWYLHFTGSTDSMLIQNFFIDTATFYPAYKSNFDSLDVIINYYDSLFGRYPFWQEKYGVCYTNLPGGMEHQTMTTIGVPNTYIIAHELCHQWFGDHVSYQDWGDVWLSEGFATFSEQLFLTKFWGAAAGKTHRQGYLSSAFTNPCGETFVTDTSGPNTLFDQTTVYSKGAMTIQMLRYMAPTDSQFFKVLQTYQQTYAMGNANTAQFKAIAESVYGFNLDTFFNEWIYGQGYPEYTITWDQVGSTVVVKLVQTTACRTAPQVFSTWLELQLHSASADTIVKVYNNVDTQIYTFNWTPTMSTVYLNPDIWTLCRQLGTVKQDTTLSSYATAGVKSISSPQVVAYPNPSDNYWKISNVAENTPLTLTGVSGKVVWRGISGKKTTLIPGGNLPAGDYFLHTGNSTDSIKLVRF
jgi:aminopeptidase N